MNVPGFWSDTRLVYIPANGLADNVVTKVRQLVLAIDPSRRVRLSRWPAPDFTLIGVYRSSNASRMLRLVEQSPAARLWALEDVDPRLAAYTVGQGPGWRFPLLNRLVEGVTSPFVVVADDDVELVRGSLRKLVKLAAAFDLDVSQPAHSSRSHVNHAITRVHPFSTLRLTSFVEIGPLFVVGPRLRERIIPFPESESMGWGTELDWLELHEERGARLAIVDAAVMTHLGRAGAAYDARSDRQRLQARLRSLDLTSLSRVQRTLSTIRPWQHERGRPR